MALSREQKAAVLFLAVPREERDLTIEEFSTDILKMSTKRVHVWLKENEEFRAAVQEARHHYKSKKGDLFEQVLHYKAMSVMYAGMADAEDQETKRKYASTVLREIKATVDTGDTVTYQGLSDEQLIAEMFKRGFKLPGAELSKFTSLVGVEDLI